MGTEESPIGANGKSAKRRQPVLGTTTGVVETIKEAAQTERALARAVDSNLSDEERSAATHAASIHGRRARLKAFSAILSQIPGEGAALSTVVDGANTILDKLDGDPEKLEKQAQRNSAKRKETTESFMRGIREQAATEQLQGNSEANGVRP
jgi:hypothetical protein